MHENNERERDKKSNEYFVAESRQSSVDCQHGICTDGALKSGISPNQLARCDYVQFVPFQFSHHPFAFAFNFKCFSHFKST